MLKKYLLVIILNLCILVNNIPVFSQPVPEDIAQQPQIQAHAKPNVFKKITGPMVGFPAGLLIGGFRGFATGAKEGTINTAEYLGDREGSIHRSAGFLTGGLWSGFKGTIYGLLKGGYDGIVYGISDPFSKKSFNLTGQYLTDYELLPEAE